MSVGGGGGQPLEEHDDPEADLEQAALEKARRINEFIVKLTRIKGSLQLTARSSMRGVCGVYCRRF